jgi:hypothetical protein
MRNRKERSEEEEPIGSCTMQRIMWEIPHNYTHTSIRVVHTHTLTSTPTCTSAAFLPTQCSVLRSSADKMSELTGLGTHVYEEGE